VAHQWRSPLAGPIEGRDALTEGFFEPQREAPLRLDTHDVLANGEHLVSIGTLDVDLGAETRSFRFTECCHTRDGRISERWVFVEDQQGLDEILESRPLKSFSTASRPNQDLPPRLPVGAGVAHRAPPSIMCSSIGDTGAPIITAMASLVAGMQRLCLPTGRLLRGAVGPPPPAPRACSRQEP
jgi:hypothetical protein